MQPDETSAKMAFDAHRDRWREVWAWLTATTPEMQEECYARGYRRGLDAAMQFDPTYLDPDVPPELDGTHAQSWAIGYKEGESDGQIFRTILFRESNIGHIRCSDPE